jgi:glycosyltransferase involved in cell wall biosynthesis
VVRLVAPPSLLPPELDLGRIELIAGLSDEQLREEYRQAWVLLLPLLDTTANNSVLEGLACGTPVVVSGTGGIRDYVGPATAALCPAGDAKAHAFATIDLLRDSARRDAAARAARTQAENFAWPKIREQLRRIMTAD